MATIRYSVSDNELVAAIKNDSNWAINQLYIKYVSTIKGYLRYKGADEEQALECYHDSMLNVLKLIRNGLLDENEGTIEPFIKKVAWYNWHKALRKKNGDVVFDTDQVSNTDIAGDNGVLATMVEKEQSVKHISRLESAMESLSGRCRAILELGFYADPPYSASEIAELLNLANANTARVTKANCIRSLRKVFYEH